MNLIDTYISVIGNNLPGKSRPDIEAEIRSLLEDILEDRSKKAGRPVDDEMIYEVLKEYGPPEKVAASYLPERYLIGPRLFPIFLMVVRIALIVLGIGVMIDLGVRLSQPGLNLDAFFDAILNMFLDFSNSALVNLGVIVLVFVIVEWAMSTSGALQKVPGLKKEKEWDPHSLLKILPPDRVKIAGPIWEIFINFLLIMLFNFNSQVIGFAQNLTDMLSGTSFISLLSNTYSFYLPWLTLLWSVHIVFNIVLLRQLYWNKFTRWFSVVLDLATIATIVAMLTGPSWFITPEALSAYGLEMSQASLLILGANQGFNSLLVVLIFIEAIDLVKTLYQLITNRAFPGLKRAIKGQ